MENELVVCHRCGMVRSASRSNCTCDLDSVVAAHEATNAKLELRVAELQAEHAQERESAINGLTLAASLREQAATLTQQLEALRKERDALRDCAVKLDAIVVNVRATPGGVVIAEGGAAAQADASVAVTLSKLVSERDTAKADSARLREAGVKLMRAYGGEAAKRPVDIRYDQYPDSSLADDAWESMFFALPATDSAAWLESKIAERMVLHVEREKSLEQQLVAATNDAARAELRARDLAKALSALVPDAEMVGRGVERGAACGRNYLAINGIVVAMEGDVCREVGYGERWTGADFDKIEATFKAPIVAVLAASPDSDERLRAVMEKVEALAHQAGWLHALGKSFKTTTEVINEALQGGA